MIEEINKGAYMHAAGEQFLLTCTVIAFGIALLLGLITRYQFEIEDAIDAVWATLRKLLR